MLVALLTVTPVAAAEPNATVAPARKLVPVMVTAVPPAVGPAEGETLVMEGGEAVEKVKPPGSVADCPPELTVTVTAPAESAGVVAEMLVALLTVTPVAAAEPNSTVAPD